MPYVSCSIDNQMKLHEMYDIFSKNFHRENIFFQLKKSMWHKVIPKTMKLFKIINLYKIQLNWCKYLLQIVL